MRLFSALCSLVLVITGLTMHKAGAVENQTLLQPHSFHALEGWSAKVAEDGLAAWRQACDAEQGDKRILNLSISAENWQHLCVTARQVPKGQAQAFMEAHFTPHLIRGNEGERGLLTGYFTPEVEGSLTPDSTYAVPLYRKPYAAEDISLTRAEIEQGALQGKGLELIWLNDAVDAFFLHIQGSGYVRLPDGKSKKLVFAGKNGRAYTAIGRYFIEKGIIRREQMSMQWLKHWLRSNPDEAAPIMQHNASYVFFDMQDTKKGIAGAAGTPLTAWQSVAIDPAYYSYGVPLYLSTQAMPELGNHAAMVVAQDTGSAIKGAQRADYYLGMGEKAERIAGALNAHTRFYALIPHSAIAQNLSR